MSFEGFIQNFSQRYNKYALAFLHAWKGCFTGNLNYHLIEDVPVSEILRVLVPNLEKFSQFELEKSWYSSLREFIVPSSFIETLIPEVALEAGFDEFSHSDLSIKNQFDPEYDPALMLSYYNKGTPKGLLESFLRNKKAWINAFIKVRIRINSDFIPWMGDFTAGDGTFLDQYELFLWELVCPLLLRSNITKEMTEKLFSDWLYVDGEGDEDTENSKDENSPPALEFMMTVDTYSKRALRVKILPETVYDDPNENSPYKIEIIERNESKWQFMVPFLLLEAECSMNLIEDLVEEGFFDL